MRDEDRLRPYVSGFAVDWLRVSAANRHRSVQGTLAFVDVSGFTRLTERLAARGKVGAEQMSDILDRTFAELLAVAYAHGAWLVKWGGDAVLLLFQGDGHAERAATAAIGMRRAMDVVGRVRTDSGPVRLRISTGLHSGSFDFFLVGSSHRELVITGPGPSMTAAMEAAAAADQVAVSPQTAELLSAGVVRARPDGVLLVARSPAVRARSPVREEPAPDVDLRMCLPAVTCKYLLSGEDEAEHRLVSVGFVEFSGVDALLAEQGPGATTAAVNAVISICQQACIRHGVTFWETDISQHGGKVMLVAGVPSTSGSDEDAMLAVARDVVEYDGILSVRVGVNSGRVFFGQFGPEVGYLGVHGLGSGGIEEGRGSGAALVVEDDLAVLGDLLPEVVLDHVDVGEAGAAVDGEDGGGFVRRAVGPVGDGDVGGGDVAGGRDDGHRGLGEGGGG